MATYVIAGADGIFMAKEIGGDSVDLPTLIDMHVTAIYGTAAGMVGTR